MYLSLFHAIFRNSLNACKEGILVNLDNIDPNIIDWNITLQQANQKPELAIKMLKMLIECLPEHQSIIDSAYKTKDYDTMHDEAHKLHGALCYCGTPRLKKMIKEFELALQEKKQTAIKKLYKQAMKESALVIETYRKIS